MATLWTAQTRRQQQDASALRAHTGAGAGAAAPAGTVTARCLDCALWLCLLSVVRSAPASHAAPAWHCPSI